jgi:hypothetical protein
LKGFDAPVATRAISLFEAGRLVDMKDVIARLCDRTV